MHGYCKLSVTALYSQPTVLYVNDITFLKSYVT